MQIPVTEFIPPNGRQSPAIAHIPEDLRSSAQTIQNFGLRLTVERLRTGEASLCIEDPSRGDFDIRIIPSKDVSIPECNRQFADMIRRFDVSSYTRWTEAIDSDELADPHNPNEDLRSNEEPF